MVLAEPLSLSASAWRAIGAEVVEPALRAAAPADAAGLAALAAAWGEGAERAGTVRVFLGPDEAGTLAGLLDARPELAAALG